MNSDKLLNLILAIAIVLMVVVNLVSPKSNNETIVVTEPAVVDVGEIVYNNIMTRSSVRSYTSEPIEDELLERIVKAGMAAPTAMNKQPWKFVIMSDKEAMTNLSEYLPNAKMMPTAAAAIVVCGDLDKALPGLTQEYWIQDTSAATENILLAAHGFGLGAVWTGGYPNPDRVTAIKAALNMPENLIPLCVIVLGHPSQEPTIKDKWLPENLIWNKF